MAKTSRRPAYLHHKARDLARVVINGKTVYLGKYGSPESRARYDQILVEWLAKQEDAAHVRFTVDELVLLFMEHAATYYRKNGKPTSEVNNLRVAFRPLVRLYGRLPVVAFRPKDLRRVRDELVREGCVRSSVNRQVGRIKRLFKWGMENDRVPDRVYRSIEKLDGLREGRTEAKESTPVRPVSGPAVEAIQPNVTRQVWAMIQLQLLTGARPGEVVILRGRDLNMSGKVWEYVPSSHKTEHHGRRRMIFLGPQAQEVVRPFLKPDLQAFLFSPAEARAEFQAARKARRQTPMTPSQAARKRSSRPKRAPRDRYTVASYDQAVRKACEVAFGMPPELRNVSRKICEPQRSELQRQAREWREAHCWHPNQLRHSAATTIRREFGLDVARTVLGHSSLAITEVYAEKDMDAAREAARRLG